MSDKHIKLGRRGELAAALFYEMRDAEVLERNWRCPFGEVDLIVIEDGCLIFCEVKTRNTLTAGTPEEQVTRKRQERYIRCAQLYSESCSVPYEHIRFDVIAVYPVDEMHGSLRFIPNAFGER